MGSIILVTREQLDSAMKQKHIPMLVGSCMGEFETVDVDPKRFVDGGSATWERGSHQAQI